MKNEYSFIPSLDQNINYKEEIISIFFKILTINPKIMEVVNS